AVRSGGDQEAEAVRWPASEEPCVAAGTRKLKPCGGRLRREPCVAAGTRKLKPCGGRLRREPRTCGCGVTARAHIHVRTRDRGHPWPLPRHTRTSTSSACLCLLTCRSRSCRRPRRGVVCRDAAACIAVAGKTGSYRSAAHTAVMVGRVRLCRRKRSRNINTPTDVARPWGWSKWHRDVPRPRVRTWMCARGVHHPHGRAAAPSGASHIRRTCPCARAQHHPLCGDCPVPSRTQGALHHAPRVVADPPG